MREFSLESTMLGENDSTDSFGKKGYIRKLLGEGKTNDYFTLILHFLKKGSINEFFLLDWKNTQYSEDKFAEQRILASIKFASRRRLKYT